MGGGSSSPRKVTVERDEGSDGLKVTDEYKRDKVADSPTTKKADDDFLRLQALYMGRIQELEARNKEFYQTSVDELAKVVENVEQKHMKPSLTPVCADLQESVLLCYLANERRSLNCAAEVRAFNSCVQAQREKILT